MRALIITFAFASLLAGCGTSQDVIACGACNSFADKHGVAAACCGRGCVIQDKSCPSGYHYVAGDGTSFAECAPADECYQPDAAVTIDMSQQD